MTRPAQRRELAEKAVATKGVSIALACRAFGVSETCFRYSPSQARKTDNTLIKALARAFRWKRMLDSGEFATIAELAEREGIASSYMTRVLRLTLLAPDIVEAILDGKQEQEVTLARLLDPFPACFEEQRHSLAKRQAPT